MKNVLVKAKYEVQSADFQQADIVFLTVSNLEKSGEKGKLFSNSGFQLKPEGFYIQKSSTGEIGVIGADEAGLMYGGLELAEQIKISRIKGVQNSNQNPYMEVCGTKFNIPLDVRTPIY